MIQRIVMVQPEQIKIWLRQWTIVADSTDSSKQQQQI